MTPLGGPEVGAEGSSVGPSTSVSDDGPITASFDVFDTVLTRRTGRPEAVFDVLAQRLVAAGRLGAPAAAFPAARSRAETRLHTLHGRPPRLSEVYSEVAHVLNLPTDAVDCFVETERAVERELSVAVPGAAEMIRSARVSSPGGRVIFLSDTAHTGALLRELLQAQGLLVDGDRVFSSADVGASKSRGGLFTSVAADLGRPGSRFRHTGGDPRADVQAAHAEGWSAAHRPHASLDREELLDQRPGETAGFGTWLAGASRVARLRAAERGVPAALAEVAAGGASSSSLCKMACTVISIGTVVVRPWGIVGVVGALTAKSFLEMIIFARPCLRELG